MDNKDIDALILDQIKDETTWTVNHEEILVDWSDKAMCYGRLHSKSNLYFSYLNQWFTIPVIILSILTGVGNFAFQKYNQDIQTIAINTIGGVNILSGIISTIGQSLKISELNEAHRVSSISWDKFYRNVKVELSKHPNERMNPIHMLKIFKEEFDRLMETSPPIRQDIIKDFKETFLNMKDFEKIEQYKKLKKPEICDELISTNDFRHKWYIEIDMNNSYNKNIDANNKKMEAQFINFKDQFYLLNNRYPMEQEIIDNLIDKIELKHLNNFIEKHNIIV
jgi:hypothetical protein